MHAAVLILFSVASVGRGELLAQKGEGGEGDDDSTIAGVKKKDVATLGKTVILLFLLKVTVVIVGYGAYRRFAPLLCRRRNVELSVGPQAPGFFDHLHDVLNPWGGGGGGGDGEPELDPRTGALRYKGVLYARVPLQANDGGEDGSEDERSVGAAR